MMFRRSGESDLEGIMAIISAAKESLKLAGIDQWQEGYPDEEAIMEDIREGHAYVLTEDEEIIATAAVTFLEEEDYKGIYEGRWGGSGTYAVIHRLAIRSDRTGKGVSDKVLGQIEDVVRKMGYPCIRTDTHEDNVRMQKLLVRNGFHFRGIIYIDGVVKRRAFEKILVDNSREQENQTEERARE